MRGLMFSDVMSLGPLGKLLLLLHSMLVVVVVREKSAIAECSNESRWRRSI
jgi:hypothetical protein